MLTSNNVSFEINFEKNNRGLVGEGGLLFNDEVLKMKFYQQAKQFIYLDKSEGDKEKLAQQQYFYNCIRQLEAPLPAFARMTGHCLFLTECRISDAMSQAMSQYLQA